MGILGSADYIPHFRLALAAVPFGRQGIIRMNLYAEVALGIDEFNKKRKFSSIDLIQGLACQGAFAYSVSLPLTPTTPIFGAPYEVFSNG